MDPSLSLTLTGAFVTGLMTSVHCVGMCGPLACTACQRSGSCSVSQSASIYQGGRLFSYTMVGMIAGAIGGSLATWLPPQTTQVLFWTIGIGLIVLSLGWIFGWKPQLPGNLRLPFAAGRSAPGWIGVATPLIPCGPLYMIFTVCALTGSPVRGAALALAFGLGTLPLLWLAQHQWWRVQRWVGQRRALILRRSVMVLTILVVLWRLQAGDGFASPDCCHPPTVP